MSENVRKYTAEAIGTAILIIIGCGAVAIGGAVEGRTLATVVGIAFSFGLAVTAMAYSIGSISGCHINPAVTIGMFTAGRMPFGEAAGYIVAQFIGGIVGAAVLVLILSGKIGGYDLAVGGLGQNGWGAGYLGGYGTTSAIVTELVATFIFVFVILGATHKLASTQVAGLTIGLTLFALHFPFINVTGLSVNPARSLGPAVFVGGSALAQMWLFLIVPSIAGAIAGWLFKSGCVDPIPAD